MPGGAASELTGDAISGLWPAGISARATRASPASRTATRRRAVSQPRTGASLASTGAWTTAAMA